MIYDSELTLGFFNKILAIKSLIRIKFYLWDMGQCYLLFNSLVYFRTQSLYQKAHLTSVGLQTFESKGR